MKGSSKMHSEGLTGNGRHYSQNPWQKHHLLMWGHPQSALGGLPFPWLAYTEVPAHLCALMIPNNTFIIRMHVSPPACKVRTGSFKLHLHSLWHCSNYNNNNTIIGGLALDLVFIYFWLPRILQGKHSRRVKLQVANWQMLSTGSIKCDRLIT